MNLHRVRGQLADWGCADSLRSERQRLTLGVPTDLQGLQAALLAADAQTLAGLALWRLLEGFGSASLSYPAGKTQRPATSRRADVLIPGIPGACMRLEAR